jgi:hypothetical protein
MTVVKNPALGLIGLIAVGLVAVKLYQGDLSVTQAAVRIGVLTGVLVLTERFLVPIARTLVSSGRPRG